MKEVKVEDLKLKELQAEASSVRRYNDVFDIVGKYTIAEAMAVLDGMAVELDECIKKELEGRKLETLKVDLL